MSDYRKFGKAAPSIGAAFGVCATLAAWHFGSSAFGINSFGAELVVVAAVTVALFWFALLRRELKRSDAVATTFDQGDADERRLETERLLKRSITDLSEEVGNAGRVADELECFHDFSSVLRGHMASVVEETGNAAADILERVKILDRDVTDLIQYLQQSGTSDQVVQVIDWSESRMAENRQLIEDFHRRQVIESKDAQSRIDQLNHETEGLDSIVKTVRDIARQTNMLAFNAAIEASRAGEHGHGFRVVASEVKALSRESDRAAIDISQGLEHLRTTINASLEAVVFERSRRESKALEAITSNVADLTSALEKLISHQREILVKARTESERIAKPIIALMGSVQFQDITRQELEHLDKAISLIDETTQALQEHLRHLERPYAEFGLRGRLDDVFAGYVMQKQRKHHDAALGRQAVETNEPSIELF